MNRLACEPGCECNDCTGGGDPMPFHQCGCGSPGCTRLVPSGKKMADICAESWRRKNAEAARATTSSPFFTFGDEATWRRLDALDAKLDRLVSFLAAMDSGLHHLPAFCELEPEHCDIGVKRALWAEYVRHGHAKAGPQG